MTTLHNYRKSTIENHEGYWFKRKAVGWGWVPARWQGNMVMLFYMLGLIFIFVRVYDTVRPKSDILMSAILPFLFLTSVLFIVAYKTGEKPRWAWSFPKKEDSTPNQKI
jgi:hypothetical protein